MKKIAFIVIAFSIAFPLVACGNKSHPLQENADSLTSENVSPIENSSKTKDSTKQSVNPTFSGDAIDFFGLTWEE